MALIPNIILHLRTGSKSFDPGAFSSPDKTNAPYSASEVHRASMAVVLLGAFFFVGIFYYCVRNCMRDDDLGTNNSRMPGATRAERPAQGVDRARMPGAIRAERPAQGVDRALVDSLPGVTYSVAKEGKESTECVVCLREFEENESLRLLPQCEHCFHQECIDMWLFSHTTCPLCRRSLQLERAGSNRGFGNLNEDIAAAELSPAREGDAVEASSSAPGVELVAVSIRDIGMQDSARNGSCEAGRVSDAGSAHRDYSRLGETQGPAAQVASSVLYGSPIFGLTESSPSGGLTSKGRIRRELRRSHSTGHSLVKQSLNRANCILPASSEEIEQALSSLERTVGELHRSRSYTIPSDQQTEKRRRSLEMGGRFRDESARPIKRQR